MSHNSWAEQHERGTSVSSYQTSESMENIYSKLSKVLGIDAMKCRKHTDFSILTQHANKKYGRIDQIKQV